MSLTTEEIARTGRELRANLALTGLTTTQAATDLGLTTEEVEALLASGPGNDPARVWQLRDYLHQAVKDTGNTPVPFTVLTSAAKVRARLWFRLYKAPRHDFTAH
ncbi:MULTISPECIES: DUF2316 family protein [unclassified Nocardiopsis]|uniref:DUF2316 family protein n=1 Tax=Nocardiopsis TaxID=2013 RepID=UPI00387AE159